MTTYWMQDYQTEEGRRAEIIIHPAGSAESADLMAQELALLLLGPGHQLLSAYDFRAEVPPSAPKGFEAGIPARGYLLAGEAVA